METQNPAIAPKNSMLDNALKNFIQIADRCGLSENMIERLRNPREKIELTLNPMLSDGEMHTYQAFIVSHNRSLGPAKGGIRMTPQVTLDDVCALATEMTWKTSLIGVPFGGGKSGIVADPSNLQPQDKETLVRNFTRSARRHIGPELYIPAPDMGTNETDMGHIRDCISYSDGASIPRGCYVTGKPVLLGGIPGRREATGRGVAITVEKAAAVLGMDLSNARVVVQGFGNVGSVAATLLADTGARIIATSDIHGGCFHSHGLDIAKLVDHVGEGGSVGEFEGGERIKGSELFGLDCDILVPAAAGNQITETNAPDIKTRIVAEGANGPTTTEADQILIDNNIFIIPDILCNAGGVFVSYLEYTQETQREQMTLADVNCRLHECIEDRFDAVLAHARQNESDMRTASLELAVMKVVEAIHSRGLLP